jgi:plastocyanin
MTMHRAITSMFVPGVSAAAAATPVAGPVLPIASRELAFHLSADTIALGTTVEWKNGDPLVHTVTAVDGGFQSTSIESGKTWRHTFISPGTSALLLYAAPVHARRHRGPLRWT